MAERLPAAMALSNRRSAMSVSDSLLVIAASQHIPASGDVHGAGAAGVASHVFSAQLYMTSPSTKGLCGACSFAQETARSMGTVLLFAS